MNTSLRFWLGGALLSLLSLTLSGRALAGGSSTLSYMPDHYTPLTTTPVAVYTNPAALRNSKGLTLFADGLLVYHYMSFDRDHTDVPEPKGAEGANTGKNTANNLGGGPFLYASLELGDFTLGVGAFSAFGGDVAWDKNAKFKDDPVFVGAVDGPQRFHSVQGTWLTGYLTMALAYEVPRTGLSLGVSANAVYTALEIEQALTAQLDDSIRSEGRMHAKLNGWSGSFGVGVQWQAVKKKLWFATSYQAPPGLWKPVHLEGPLRLNLGSGVNRQTIEVEQDFPDIVQAGVRYRPTKAWELRLSGNYMRMSVMRSQCLARKGRACRVNDQGLANPNDGAVANFVRRWRDTYGGRLSASRFFARERYELFGGVMYDSSAIPNSTLEPGIVDGHDLGGTLGGRLRVLPSLEIGLSYLHQVMLPRDNRGESKLTSYKPPNHVPSPEGRYEQWCGILNLNVTGRFGQ